MIAPKIRFKQYFSLGLTLSLTGAICSYAQEAASGDDEDIFELSPFEVDGSKDVGYRAANSLAGSRLNTSLRDTSSVIDVFTREMMDDLGATDLKDVVAYGNNLVQSTEDDTHGFGNVQVGASPSFNFRVRGLPATRARNYFAYGYEFDSYNMERLDEARGPNSILFGFGSPGGVINNSTKQAHFGKQKGRVEFTTGDEIKARTALDWNEVLIDDRLAVRVNLLKHEEEGWMYYTHDDHEAIDLALTYKPFEKTKILFDYEEYEKNDTTSRPFNHHNWAEKWEDIGNPLLAGGWDLRNNSTVNPDLDSTDLAHMQALSGTNDNNKDGYWSITSNDGQVANWRGMVRARWPNGKKDDGSNLTFFNGGRNVAIEPDGVLGVNVFGPSTSRDFKIKNKTAIVEHEIVKDLFVSFAATENEVDWDLFLHNASFLQGDPNLWLPAATITDNLPDVDNPVLNPYAGLTYIEASTMRRVQEELFESQRVSLSYKIDFKELLGSEKAGNVLGVHRIAGLYEDSDYTVEEISMRESVFIDGVLPRPDLGNNVRNRLLRRTYIEDPSDPLQYAIGEFEPVNLTLEDGSVLTSDFVPFQRRYDFTRDNISKMVSLQSFWFDGRLVTTFGERSDELTFHAFGELLDPSGAIVRDPDNLTISEFTGTTQQLGAVFHVTKKLSIFANESDSLGVPDFPRTMVPDGSFNEPTQGDGSDLGIKFDALENKLSLTATYFNAAQKNDTRGGNPDNWGQEQIVDALLVEGLLAEADAEQYRLYGNGHTWDTETEGYELAAVGRITKNWNVRLNYSWTDKEITNIAPRIVSWIEDVGRPFWSSYDRDNPNTPEADNILDDIVDGETSLRDRINNFESQLNNIIVNGTTLRGLRQDKVSVFNSYDFRDGRLKGLGLGAGFRYMSAPVVGQDADGRHMYGSSNSNFDFMAKYKTKLMDRNVTYQVNVKNAFRDEVEWSPISVVYADNIDAIVLFPPREITFSVRLDF